MAVFRNRPKLSKRAAIAGALACLFLLQSFLVALPSRHSRHESGGGPLFAAASGEVCRAEARADGGGPAQERLHRDQCCVLCPAGGRDGASHLAIFVYAIATLSISPKGVAPGASADDAGRRPERRVNPWSSRAPPLLS